MAYLIGAITGSVIIMRLLSWLMLWILKKWQDDGYSKLIVGHVAALLLSSLIGGMGFADGGAFVPIYALALYLPGALFWLAFDCFSKRRKQARAILTYSEVGNLDDIRCRKNRGKLPKNLENCSPTYRFLSNPKVVH